MTLSPEGSPNRDQSPSRRLANIRDTLTKTRISPDLLADIIDARQASQNLSAGVPRAVQDSKAIASDTAALQPPTFDVIIEFNRDFPGGMSRARLTFLAAYLKARVPGAGLPPTTPEFQLAFSTGHPMDDDALVQAFGPSDTVKMQKSLWTDNYVFASLSSDTIAKLLNWTVTLPGSESDSTGSRKRVPLIYKIWKDHKIARCVYESVRTIKGDAARRSFGADGKGIVWAIADTGIDQGHPHFRLLDTLKLEGGLRHRDFTEEHSSEDEAERAALQDEDGHGTHVAGIIAGFSCLKATVPGIVSDVEKIVVTAQERDGEGNTMSMIFERTEPISGIARHCKLLSLRVLKRGETGDLSNLLAAIGYIQKCNDYGRSLKIHGLNLSLGYEFNPEWFAAGQSPLCVEVDRLVRSGVCVVVAAGNAGYGIVRSYAGGGELAVHVGTISDPGNASLAITVGSTHRDMPHVYGVSYFSAKGPTADGRIKPDLIAPGERIVSCALMDSKSQQGKEAPFRGDSGTSMAAAHVSGAIAAFLSVRDEFKGKPDQVKEIFMKSAMDLRRRKEFQGAGLVDLMRALQSV